MAEDDTNMTKEMEKMTIGPISPIDFEGRFIPPVEITVPAKAASEMSDVLARQIDPAPFYSSLSASTETLNLANIAEAVSQTPVPKFQEENASVSQIGFDQIVRSAAILEAAAEAAPNIEQSEVFDSLAKQLTSEAGTLAFKVSPRSFEKGSNLIDKLMNTRLTRREFIKKGINLILMATFLSACGRGVIPTTTSEPGGTSTQTTEVPPTETASPTVTETASPTATVTETPTETASPTETSTETPIPTETAAPTDEEIILKNILLCRPDDPGKWADRPWGEKQFTNLGGYDPWGGHYAAGWRYIYTTEGGAKKMCFYLFVIQEDASGKKYTLFRMFDKDSNIFEFTVPGAYETPSDLPGVLNSQYEADHAD